MSGLIAIIILSLIQIPLAMAELIEATDLSVGRNHVCAFTTQGIKCFGNSEKATLKTPAAVKNPRQLKTGNKFSCMIVDDGIRCWGEIPNSKKTDILIGKKEIPNPKLLSVGHEHACAVSDKDIVKCWGKSDFGEINPPENLKNISEISLGMNNSCVIADGKVVCWGMSIDGTTDVPPELKNPKNLTSGLWHHCVSTDDGIKCWGYPYKESIPPVGMTINEFTSGGFYNCAIIETGVVCWDESGSTALVEESLGATRLSVGSAYACAITPEKGVICWKLGAASKGRYTLLKSFVPAGGISRIEYISAAQSSTCAYGDEGFLKCWGLNPDGALDVPKKIPNPISSLTVGLHKTCAISDNVLSCWGTKNEAYEVPSRLGDVNLVSSGGYHVCASNKKSIKCWGENIRGALDIPKGLTNISSISSGFSHACAIANGLVKCWGGKNLIRNVDPAKKITNAISLCAGGTFSCSISAKGKIQCWGDKIQFVGDSKHLDLNGNEVLNIPEEISMASVTEISCGLSHACAIYNGKVSCWGDGAFLPARIVVPAIKNPRKLTAGWNHTCAIGDKGLSCWGNMLNIDMPTFSLEK